MDIGECFEALAMAVGHLATAAGRLIKRYDANEICSHLDVNVAPIDADFADMKAAVAELLRLKKESDGRSAA